MRDETTAPAGHASVGGRAPSRRVPVAMQRRMRTLDELAHLDDATFEALLERCWYRRLDKGARFIVEGSDAEAMFFVLEGEIRVEVNGRTVELLAAPTTIGLLSILDDAPRTASVEAFSQVDIVMLLESDFEELLDQHASLVKGTIDFLTSQIRQAQRRDESLRHAFDDHFHSPNARLVQGPYVMGDFPMTAIVVQTTPERIAACLPPGLRPVPGLEGRYLLTFNDFSDVHSEHPAAEGKTFSYRETTPFIPVLGPGLKPAVFSPELYLDSYMPIVLGRELYGFPKRYGEARFGERHIDLHIGATLSLRAAWSDAEPVAAGDMLALLQGALLGKATFRFPGQVRALESLFSLVDRPLMRKAWPAMPVLVHSQVPDGRRDGETMRIDELVEIPFHVRRISHFELLREPAIRGFEDWILAGDAVAAVRLRMEASFGRAHRPVDYASGVRQRAASMTAPWRAFSDRLARLRQGLRRDGDGAATQAP